MQDHRPWIPLFSLTTVLFPGGVLPLKVFETCYLDLLRKCMKKQQQFGIVLIRSGQEVGVAAESESFGRLTQITEWDMQDLGVMMLRTVSSQRFRILQKRVLADQRLEAQVELIAADQPGKPYQTHLQYAAPRTALAIQARLHCRCSSTTPVGSPTAGTKSCRYR